jgi:hypothetical protein
MVRRSFLDRVYGPLYPAHLPSIPLISFLGKRFQISLFPLSKCFPCFLAATPLSFALVLRQLAPASYSVYLRFHQEHHH